MKWIHSARRFVTNEDGLETVEYAIITGLIVVASIGAISAIGVWVAEQFTTLQTTLEGGGGGGGE